MEGPSGLFMNSAAKREAGKNRWQGTISLNPSSEKSNVDECLGAAFQKKTRGGCRDLAEGHVSAALLGSRRGSQKPQNIRGGAGGDVCLETRKRYMDPE